MISAPGEEMLLVDLVPWEELKTVRVVGMAAGLGWGHVQREQ